MSIGVVALAAGFGGAWLHARTAPNSQGSQSLHDRIHRTLKLDASQNERLHTLEASFKVEKDRLEGEMAAANRELADAMSQDKAFTPKVQAAIDHFHHAMGALQKVSVEHVFEMRAILTPEQQVAFDAQVRDALLASSGADKRGAKAP
jgi:nickel and cobalt resistance protein CnrR